MTASPESDRLALWSDDPTSTDLLSFDAVAATLADALLDEALDPVALGLSGAWGSGKTTVLRLVEQELYARADENRRIVVIPTEPWRYDPTTGIKETLIGQVLDALADEVEASPAEASVKARAKELAGKLAKRIDWAKAVKIATTTSIAFQLPTVNELLSLVKPADGGDDDVRGLEEFRTEFQNLMASDALAHVRAVAVLVDDLDRCLPETVIETLEAIRLFLAVPKMSFVIAADEDRVADAIATRFQQVGRGEPTSDREDESPAQLYLHKIVQTTIPLPALSRFDTQAFLLLLQLQDQIEAHAFTVIVNQCADVRRAGGDIDDIKGVDGVDISDELALASRLTPILYEKLHGNPRRIKRFLNDLRVRQAIAARRGITLDPAVVAKMIVLEVLLSDEFKEVLKWLAAGTLRDQLRDLERRAGRTPEEAGAGEQDGAQEADANKQADEPPANDRRPGGKLAVAAAEAKQASKTPATFTDAFVRWAKLPPELASVDLAPYLQLAAAFQGVTLLDEELPEQLRDLAANLLSTARAENRAVTDADLDALSTDEAEALLLHMGRTVRDQPARQKTAITGMLRVAKRAGGEVAATAKQALLMLPADDLQVATPILFDGRNDTERPVLKAWRAQLEPGTPVARAIDNALKQT